jgi:ABC-type dipeptide/oligopeptide/nickel transport system permease subunit
MAEAGAAMPRRRRFGRLAVLVGDPGARVALAVIAGFVLLAVFAPLIAPADPTAQDVANALLPPGADHWFGTDEFGRDILSRMIYGARPALLVGVLSALLAMVIGVPLGMLAGLEGGWIDTAISTVVDVMLSFPPILLALLVVALIGSGVVVLVVAIGIAHVPIFIRLARSSTLLVREMDYVAASRTFGARRLRVLRQHVLPNIVGPLIVMGTLSIAGAIREEAGLSFLGIGIQPPTPSWGNLIRDGVDMIMNAPWLALIAGGCVTLSVLAFNMLGDSIRDALDPRDLAASATRKEGR